MSAVDVHPLYSPWGRFGLYSFFIDGSEPAIIDTGIASSPADGIAAALLQLGRRVEDVRWIFLTHGHIDHIGGAHALWEMTGRQAKVVIHEADAPFLRSRRTHVDEYLAARGRYINDADGEAKLTAICERAISGEMEPHLLVRDGDEIVLGPDVTIQVHCVPGHTAGHIAFYSASAMAQPVLFCGDTLFSGGCGRLFEGTPAQMQHSLDALAALPDATQVCCAHEYTLSNLRFALAVEPNNAALLHHMEHCEALRAQGRPTLPSSMVLERSINPFLRTRETAVVAAAHRHDTRIHPQQAHEVLAALRAWKNDF